MTTAPVFAPLSAYLWAWAACCRGKTLSTTDRIFPASIRLLMKTRSSGFSLTSTQRTFLSPTSDVHSIWHSCLVLKLTKTRRPCGVSEPLVRLNELLPRMSMITS